MKRFQSRLILLVEDNVNDELLTLRALREGKVPAEVYVVRDGKQALAILHGVERLPSEPDLILLDLNLPMQSGLEILKKIREHKDTFSTPVVMLTSSDSRNDM